MSSVNFISFIWHWTSQLCLFIVQILLVIVIVMKLFIGNKYWWVWRHKQFSVQLAIGMIVNNSNGLITLPPPVKFTFIFYLRNTTHNSTTQPQEWNWRKYWEMWERQSKEMLLKEKVIPHMQEKYYVGHPIHILKVNLI